jgi:hypothetical protein
VPRTLGGKAAAGEHPAGSPGLKLTLKRWKMSVSRRLGTLVFFGVPAIVGGGIVYALTNGDYTSVAVYEVLLYIFAGALVSK